LVKPSHVHTCLDRATREKQRVGRGASLVHDGDSFAVAGIWDLDCQQDSNRHRAYNQLHCVVTPAKAVIVGTPIVGDAQNSLVGPTVISTALWGSRGYEVIPARSLGRRKRSGGGGGGTLKFLPLV